MSDVFTTDYLFNLAGAKALADQQEFDSTAEKVAFVKGVRLAAHAIEAGSIYEGQRDPATGDVVVTRNGVLMDLRLDVRNHSPTGFEWGYNGSGPAQLALAMTVAEVGKRKATFQGAYQAVKDELIAPIQGGRWMLTGSQVRDAWERYYTHAQKRLAEAQA